MKYTLQRDLIPNIVLGIPIISDDKDDTKKTKKLVRISMKSLCQL